VLGDFFVVAGAQALAGLLQNRLSRRMVRRWAPAGGLATKSVLH
jgi:hypothetical protein